jgi:hypothetical protein
MVNISLARSLLSFTVICTFDYFYILIPPFSLSLAGLYYDYTTTMMMMCVVSLYHSIFTSGNFVAFSLDRSVYISIF